MVQTKTLAEIWARQGHLERAIAIYEELVARDTQSCAEYEDRLVELRAQWQSQISQGGRLRRVEHLRTLLQRVQKRRHDR